MPAEMTTAQLEATRRAPPLPRAVVNDFAVQVATVNG